MFEGRPIKEDAARVFDVVRKGGVAIIPLSVGYAVVGHEDEAIRRMYAAKERSFDKPCGNLGDWPLFNELLHVSDLAREVVRTIIQDHDLPFSLVAPFRAEHPLAAGLPPFTLQNATKAGTMDVLLNAGPLHDEIARLARVSSYGVSGSSANVSLSGSKFVLREVETQVRRIADIEIDYGLVPYHNAQGLGSTIVDLRDFTTVRAGCVYDQIARVIQEKFGIDLRTGVATRG